MRLGPSTSGLRSGGYEARAGSAPRAHAVLTIFEEDKRYLEVRVARLDTGMAWAEDPPSRTRPLIGNLEATPLESAEVQPRPRFWCPAHTRSGRWRPRIIALDANFLLDKNVRVFL